MMCMCMHRARVSVLGGGARRRCRCSYCGSVHPPMLLRQPDLAPDVIREVEHPAAAEAQRVRHQSEAVGPLATSAAARAQQQRRVVVPWEARDVPGGPAVELDARRAAHALLHGGRAHAELLGRLVR
eukprot:scaffold2599_cov74-Phaeocystis_antarctica.AAC.11